MDPLSVTASIIAVLGLAKSATSGVRRLRDLQSAPQEIAALTEEIVELQYVLAAASSLNSGGKLKFHLASLVRVFNELDELIKERLSTAPASCTKATSLQVNDQTNVGGTTRRASLMTKSSLNYIRYKSRITSLQEKFTKVRNSIATILIAQNLHETLATQASLQNIAQTQSQLTDKMQMLIGRPASSGQETWITATDKAERGAAVATADCATALQSNGKPMNSAIPISPQSAAPIPRRSCRDWCRCACHRRTIWMSPESLSMLCGKLRITSIGGFWSAIPCTLKTCLLPENQRYSLAFQWPGWFLNSMFLISTTGFEFILQIPRVRPATDEVFTISGYGNVSDIDTLFRRRLASPYDVDNNGWSLLHEACFGGHLVLAKYLCNEGADPYLETQVYETPRDKALGSIFNGSAATYGWPLQTIEEFETLFDMRCWIQEQCFTRLHELILGFRSGNLETELLHCTADEIEAQDVKGRTPLWWSVAKGTEVDSLALLRFGANIITPDRGKWTPLLMAICTQNTDQLHLLVEFYSDLTWKPVEIPPQRTIFPRNSRECDPRRFAYPPKYTDQRIRCGRARLFGPNGERDRNGSGRLG